MLLYLKFVDTILLLLLVNKQHTQFAACTPGDFPLMRFNPGLCRLELGGVLVAVDLVVNHLGLYGGCFLSKLASHFALGVGFVLELALAVKQQPAKAASIEACFLLVGFGLFQILSTNVSTAHFLDRLNLKQIFWFTGARLGTSYLDKSESQTQNVKARL